MAPEPERLEQLIAVVSEAQDTALQLSSRLSTLDDPQAGEAAVISRQLTTTLIALFEPATPPSLGDVAELLTGLSTGCVGRLAGLKPLLARAVAVARR